DEGNETIALNSAIEGLAGGSATITLTDAEIPSLASAKGVSPPLTFESHNYPNPFNPTTTIKYALPSAMDVELTVYNAVGQAVRTLVAEHQRTGHYGVEWDATDDSGHSVAAGIYFYRLQAGGKFLAVDKMLLLR
ncbi:MAG: T9SS type A sorting domain-containing protein, partial [Gemmatimonadetes bacterium]|nr:T9SS type A sorting domain-containing protein [Gemmatimonadota bacterium]